MQLERAEREEKHGPIRSEGEEELQEAEKKAASASETLLVRWHKELGATLEQRQRCIKATRALLQQIEQVAVLEK